MHTGACMICYRFVHACWVCVHSGACVVCYRCMHACWACVHTGACVVCHGCVRACWACVHSAAFMVCHKCVHACWVCISRAAARFRPGSPPLGCTPCCWVELLCVGHVLARFGHCSQGPSAPLPNSPACSLLGARVYATMRWQLQQLTQLRGFCLLPTPLLLEHADLAQTPNPCKPCPLPPCSGTSSLTTSC